MKIAYLTSVYARASDTFVRNEVIELRQRGHTVHTFSVRREAVGAAQLDEVRREQASTTYILEQAPWALALAFAGMWMQRPSNMLKAFRLAWKTRIKGVKGCLLQMAYLIEAAFLARRLLTLKVDILHNHIAENSANVAMLASQISGVPFSMTVHGPGIFYHPREWALGEKIARSAFTATITDFCKSQCMLFSDEAHWHKLNVVRCSVGPDFRVDGLAPIPVAPRLIFVGRLCAEKGLTVLVEAVARLAEAGVQLELALIGDGPSRPLVEAIVRDKGLQSHIKLLGWRSSEGVRQELENSRVLVLPSFAEGLPVVIMEALALGRPVISTQIAGIPELVVTQDNGWLVPPGAVEPLIEALRQATQSPVATLTAMGEAGSRRVRLLHNFAHEMDKLEALLTAHAQTSAH